ncbi:hypothetical protein FB645_000947 [Coemansia sp. IMI 203386]|nr:hypothetical protein FB645_000947 [Coemansia sp. IMI 203386]
MPDGTSRCDNCIRDNIPCVWRESKRRGPKRKNTSSPQRSVASISNLLNESENHNGKKEVPDNKANGRGVGPLASSLRPLVLKDSTGGQIRRPTAVVVPSCDGLLAEFYSKVPGDLRKALLAYYTYLYALCPVLHPSTVMRKAINGHLDTLLIDVLHATAGFFNSASNDSSTSASLDPLFERATQILHRAEMPSVDRMCALQILDMLLTGRHGYRKYDVYKASLTALILQLGWHELDQHENLAPVDTWDQWVERETKRRVFWTNFKQDSQQSAIFSRRPYLDDTRIHVRRPCLDSDWDELSTQVLLTNIGETNAESTQLHAIHTIQNSFIQTFSLSAPSEVYLSRVGMFFIDAKKNWLRQRNDNRRWTQNADAATPLGNSLLFKKFDQEMRQWRTDMIAAETLKDDEVDPDNIQYFGSPRHRGFIARSRYFCINIYSYALLIFLHLSNRPSFLPEAEPTNSGDVFIRGMLMDVLGHAWVLGLVAGDVDLESWKKSLKACHDLSLTIVANVDIPVAFVDPLVPPCVVVSISVLLRQLRSLENTGVERKQEMEALGNDLMIQWTFFNDLGTLWNIDSLLSLLRHLGIDHALANIASETKP